MREHAQIHDSRESGPFETGSAAEAATEVGADDDLSLPVGDVVLTIFIVIAAVGATAMIAALI